MLAFRSVQQSNHCAREEFLYELKAGPAGGRLRRPSSAGSTRLAGAGVRFISDADARATNLSVDGGQDRLARLARRRFGLFPGALARLKAEW